MIWDANGAGLFGNTARDSARYAVMRCGATRWMDTSPADLPADGPLRTARYEPANFSGSFGRVVRVGFGESPSPSAPNRLSYPHEHLHITLHFDESPRRRFINVKIQKSKRFTLMIWILISGYSKSARPNICKTMCWQWAVRFEISPNFQ